MSSREKPMHIPLFIDAYLAGTMMLDPEQDGCNLRLMMAAWRQPDCALPYDDKQLATICRLPVARWRKIKGPILAMWSLDNGRLFQKRLRQEWSYVQKKRDQSRSAVAERERRKHQSNASDDASDDLTKTASGDVSPMVRGERWEVKSPFQEEEIGRGDTHARESRGFPVIAGGRS